MGTDESDSMVQGSSPMAESDSMVQGSEQEKEVREVLGGLRSEEGSCGVTVKNLMLEDTGTQRSDRM